MKTRKENSVNLEKRNFETLENNELIQIKGGTEEYIGGTPTVIDCDFD